VIGWQGKSAATARVAAALPSNARQIAVLKWAAV
jgi:hypothetical protein